MFALLSREQTPHAAVWHGQAVTHPVIVGMLGPGWCIGKEAARLALDIPILGDWGHGNCFIVVCFQRKVAQVLLGQLPSKEDVANLQVAQSVSVAPPAGDSPGLYHILLALYKK